MHNAGEQHSKSLITSPLLSFSSVGLTFLKHSSSSLAWSAFQVGQEKTWWTLTKIQVYISKFWVQIVSDIIGRCVYILWYHVSSLFTFIICFLSRPIRSFEAIKVTLTTKCFRDIPRMHSWCVFSLVKIQVPGPNPNPKDEALLAGWLLSTLCCFGKIWSPAVDACER